MRSRTPFALLVSIPLAASLAAGAQAAAPPSPTGSDALVRLTGELVRTAVERGGTAHTAVQVGNLFVPVSGDRLDAVPARSRVTVDVHVPAVVADAATDDRALTLRGLGGTPKRHDLDRSDLRAASDSTPASAGSAIGRATKDAAFAPGADPLQVDTLVTAAAASATYSPATRQITYVEVTPRGMTAAPVTTARAEQQVAASDAYWRDNSAGGLRIGAPTVTQRIASAYTCSDDPFLMWSEAAERTGWQWTDDASLVLSLPPAAERSCGYGLGTVGFSPNDGGVVRVSGTDHPVLSHELGHNMSLGHADFLACAGRSDAGLAGSGEWGSGCVELEYADTLDIMGVSDTTSTPMLSASQSVPTGLLPAASTVAVGKGTTDVTLLPVSGGTGTRAAVVTNAATGVRYYVEYRTATGRDSTNPVGMRTGVRVLRTNAAFGSSVLLDPSPTGDHDTDAVLDPGATLTSYDRTLRITTLSTGPGQAVVRIANAGNAPFVLRSRPTVTGTRGVGHTLTASTGSWSPTPSSHSYRWRRDGVAIWGATGRTYRPRTADAGRYVTVTVTARRTGYTTRSVTSWRAGIPIHSTTRPYLVGTREAGRTLTVMVGAWTPRPSSYSYQWYRNGRAVSGATAKTYTVRSIDRGQKIQAKVTVRRTGHVSGSRRTYSAVISS